MAKGNCGPNQKKICLMGSQWAREGIIEGFRGGEGEFGSEVLEVTVWRLTGGGCSISGVWVKSMVSGVLVVILLNLQANSQFLNEFSTSPLGT